MDKASKGQSTMPTQKTAVFIRSVADRPRPEAVRECLEGCEFERLVPLQATVVIKPNLCTAVQEKAAMANTDPELTAAVCEALLSRTRRVFIGESDGLRQSAWEAFEVSGYVELARRLGVELVNFSEAPRTRVPCEPAGDIELPRLALEADVFITLPVLKTHALTYFTGALKNQWGCLPQHDRILLHRYLDPLLVSLHRLLKPKLAVMDGIIGMEGRGPANGKPRRLDLVLASRDAVALDATAARLVGLDPARARHLVLAAEQGLGCLAQDRIEVDGDWTRHATQFEPPVLDCAIAAMNYMTRYRWFVRHALERDYVFYPVRGFVQLLRKLRVVEGG